MHYSKFHYIYQKSNNHRVLNKNQTTTEPPPPPYTRDQFMEISAGGRPEETRSGYFPFTPLRAL